MPGSNPNEIEKLGERAIRIVWDDGHVSEYPNTELRFRCSCASCVDEWSGERHLQRTQVAADVHPIDLQLVGNYAMHLTWSDGHATGIYSFDYLRALCPCADCARRRGRGA